MLGFPHDTINIEAHHGNIKDEKYSHVFFEGFDICLNALDNVDARRHVNRVCLAAGLPLIESGTEGYLGQVRAIMKGQTQCYECNPPKKEVTYPVCTIRNHPEKPVHCIAWAKDLLFPKLFGGEETDLVDASEGQTGNEDATPCEGKIPETAPTLCREEGESISDFAERVFKVVFELDVERLIRMEDIWKEKKRTPPTPIRLTELLKESLPDAAALASDDRREWTVVENASIFLATIRAVLEERSDEVGRMKFDKDDQHTLDLVASAANLRSHIFQIQMQSRWKIKEIAGKIIPAIATTNAIIAGFIVLEAMKVLAGRHQDCRYSVCQRHLSGKKRDLLLLGSMLDPPNPTCFVCGATLLTLTIDTTTTTVGHLIDDIVKKHLSFNRPTIDLISGEGDQLCEGEEVDLDEVEKAKYAKYRCMALATLPAPVADGAELEITDTSQNVSLRILVRHAILDPEETPSGFTLTGALEPQAASMPSNECGSSSKRPRDEDEMDSKQARTGGADVDDESLIVLD